jgi:hypothetical protein
VDWFVAANVPEKRIFLTLSLSSALKMEIPRFSETLASTNQYRRLVNPKNIVRKIKDVF